MSEIRSALDAFSVQIREGGLDDYLDELEQVIKTRRANLDRESRRYSNYPVGSLVRFNERVRPQYLRGAQARVVSHSPSRGGKYDVEVTLLTSMGKYRTGAPVRAMFEIIDPIEKEV